MNYKSYKALNIAANAAGLSVVLFFAVEKGTGRISAISPQLRTACCIVMFALSIALLVFTVRARSLYRRDADDSVKIQLDRLLFNLFKPMFVSTLLILNGVFSQLDSAGACFYTSLIIFMIGILIDGASRRKQG